MIINRSSDLYMGVTKRLTQIRSLAEVSAEYAIHDNHSVALSGVFEAINELASLIEDDLGQIETSGQQEVAV